MNQNSNSTRDYFMLTMESIGLSSTPARVWVNEESILSSTRLGQGPFRNLKFSETPRFVFDRTGRRGRLWDAYMVSIFGWLVSDRLKTLLEQSHLGKMAFQQVDVEYKKFEAPGPDYWLCDFVEYLDCVDEDKSDIDYQHDAPVKNYLELRSAVIKEDVVGQRHVFRLQHATLKTIVDDVFVGAIRSEKVTGFDFQKIKK
ncbi:Protein of uncharacterised function (DUF1629) [Bordetella ansorpii]|uniref:Protein of uncharacterized function (DUF1629) n=1 Tax=Bordetella ansorpii TaxID=288768 RepID=A0A157SD54_9BORD|nr:DUF1629 domain-containing protein [Bordetella ansorpii]SAI68163.1 Protein of uncharacterised function (DUF1629) [Bordetella ansorpii]